MKHPNITLSLEVARALQFGASIVALESTVITQKAKVQPDEIYDNAIEQ
ncbi:MAG: hypothetical protein MUO77_07250 [Anaerolineales bacterium]|nr:hypothetical protein [Anaerolineales bacterium]